MVDTVHDPDIPNVPNLLAELLQTAVIFTGTTAFVREVTVEAGQEAVAQARVEVGVKAQAVAETRDETGVEVRIAEGKEAEVEGKIWAEVAVAAAVAAAAAVVVVEEEEKEEA